MKKLINDKERVVEEMIEGLVLMNPLLQFIPSQNVIVRRDCSTEEAKSKVALISGGGSGHEPSHAGFVGRGMLSAAVLGNVFSSPTPSQVLTAIRAVTGSKGCLLIVKNYTGDRLNFGMAAEMARSEGFKVEMVIVGDDVALLDDEKNENAGRRGLAGTLFVHKICGALSESGKDLESIHKIATQAAENIFTIGIGLSSCIIPAVGHASFQLNESEVEVGLGIHGEHGKYKSELKTADEHSDEMIEILLEHNKNSSKQVVLMVNNLGGTTLMELAIVARRAVKQLESKGIQVSRIFSGSFMTSLEMQGVSLTILNPFESEVESWLDFPTTALAWPNSTKATVDVHLPSVSDQSKFAMKSDALDTFSQIQKLATENPKGNQNFDCKKWIESVINKLFKVTPHLTELDGLVGDGDLGINLEKAGKIILSKLDSFPENSTAFVSALALILGDELGGTTGVLYSVFLLKMAKSLKETGGKDEKDWAKSIQEGTEGICSLGGAKVGDRTMIDALIPASAEYVKNVNEGKSTKDSLKKAAEAAKKGAESTCDLVAKKGRSSYIGDRAKGHPDPGAQAISYLFQFALESLE